MKMQVKNIGPINLRTAASSKSLLKNPGFMTCTIFLGLGIITCILAAVPLIICATYYDEMVIGLSEDLKIAGAGFLIFGLLIVIVSILGMVYTSDASRRKRDDMVNYILEESDQMDFAQMPTYLNPAFLNVDSQNDKMKDVTF